GTVASATFSTARLRTKCGTPSMCRCYWYARSRCRGVCARRTPVPPIRRLTQAPLQRRNTRLESSFPEQRISASHLRRGWHARRLSLPRTGEVDNRRGTLLWRSTLRRRQPESYRFRTRQERIHLSKAIALSIRRSATLH